MATMVKSFAIQGIDGYCVDIEIKMLEGQPATLIIGLGDQAVKEAAERIQAAIDESGYVFPKKRVIISLHPVIKRKGVHTLILQWQSGCFSKMEILVQRICQIMDLLGSCH